MPDSYSTTGMAMGRAAWARAPQGRAAQVECPAPPACPACGGLECLCRPHFFAGQLLTEDDLNRLEGYVVAKNKLHNRHLHGWGVVCGLEVVCDPCGQGVLVRPGHALAPCGEDIVVCNDQAVDVCALIQACRPATAPDCPPVAPSLPSPRPGAGDPCGDAIERWVLAICYDEHPSRGVMPLRPPTESCGCGSGGGCGCGSKSKAKSCGCGARSGARCGCGSGKTATGSGAKSRGTYATRGPAAVACEPTLICEGYRFIAYKAATRDRLQVGGEGRSGLGAALAGAGSADQGPLIDRVLCCWQALVERLDRPPVNASKADLFRWCCDMRSALIDFVSDYPTTDCRLVARARALACPDPAAYDSDVAYQQALVAVAITSAEVAAEHLRYCLCQALLPPCPPVPECNCVPLATIEVRRSDCQIIGVCNWGERKFALTIPQLQYWLSPLHIGQTLSRAVERLCCTPLHRERQLKYPTRESIAPAHVDRGTAASASAFPAAGPTDAATAATRPVETGEAQGPSQLATLLLAQAFRNQSRPLDAATVLLDALGFVDDKNAPLLSSLERANPVSMLLANQVLAPFVSSLLPGGKLPGGAEKLVGAPATTAAAAPAEVAELRRMVADLSKTVSAQGDEIKKLRTGRRPGS